VEVLNEMSMDTVYKNIRPNQKHFFTTLIGVVLRLHVSGEKTTSVPTESDW
jgi:hypothetical protein